jgi:hypothetical protein
MSQKTSTEVVNSKLENWFWKAVTPQNMYHLVNKPQILFVYAPVSLLEDTF